MPPIISFSPSTIQPTGSPVQSLDSVISATERGIRAGQQLPSYASAVTTGLTNAVDLYRKDQEADLNMQLKEEQIQAAQITNDVRALEAEVMLENEDAIKTSKALELQNQVKQLQTINQDLDNEMIIEEKLASPLASVRREVMTDPNLAGTLFRNPKKAEGYLGRLSKDLTPAETQAAFASLNFSKKMELDARMKIANAKGLGQRAAQSAEAAAKARQDIGVDAIIGGLSDEQVANELTMYPSGTAPVFDDRDEINPALGPGKPTGKITEVDVYRKGKAYAKNVPLDQGNKIKIVQNNYKNIDALERQDLNMSAASPEERQPRPPAPQKQSTAQDVSITAQNFNPIKASIVSTNTLPESKLPLLDTPSDNIFKYVQQSAENPAYASSPANTKAKDANVETISRVITDQEYESIPTVRQEYNNARVEKYNKALEIGIEIEDSNSQYSGRYMTNLIAPYKVTDPKQLYYMDRAPIIKSAINRDINALIKKEREKLLLPINKRRNQNSFQQSVAANR